jgi:dTDP-4-dehydrorhamnose 3,5-epimerase
VDVLQTKLPGVLVLQPDVFSDSRGSFMETWSRHSYEDIGIKEEFVQDNVSLSRKGVLRGLHYQFPHAQGKLIQVLSGEVFDVAVDIRLGSGTFGKWIAEKLSGDNHRQLYIPPGFAHGFYVMSESAMFAYKCTDYYNRQAEGGIIWNDSQLNIDWPSEAPLLSVKDKALPSLKDIDTEKLPRFEGTS